MEKSRAPSINELEKVETFLNENLRVHEPWSITEEFPLALQKRNVQNLRILTDSSQKILSHAAVKFIFVKTPMGIFKVAGIGSVFTDPSHRKKGFSQQVINDCISHARDHLCDFAILWSDLYQFYKKFDFELAGSEISYHINKPLSTDVTPNIKFMNTPNISPNALLKVYSNHTVSSWRTSSDIKKYLGIPKSTIYTSWNSENKLVAYAVEGRGADLTNYVHEWGGGISQLLPLLNYVFKQTNTPFTFMVPAHSENLINKLDEQNVSRHDGYLGLILPLNTKNLFFKIHRFAKQIGINDLILEEKHSEYYFGTKTSLFKTKHVQELTRLIFGPQKAHQIHNFDPATTSLLEKMFPIPMWVWGWDSV